MNGDTPNNPSSPNNPDNNDGHTNQNGPGTTTENQAGNQPNEAPADGSAAEPAVSTAVVDGDKVSEDQLFETNQASTDPVSTAAKVTIEGSEKGSVTVEKGTTFAQALEKAGIKNVAGTTFKVGNKAVAMSGKITGDTTITSVTKARGS